MSTASEPSPNVPSLEGSLDPPSPPGSGDRSEPRRSLARGSARLPLAVGVDLSPESAAALSYALLLASQLDRPVVVVHAVGLLEEAGVRPPPVLDAIIDSARARSGAFDVDVNIVVEDGPPAAVIERVADRSGAELVVVGRRGLGDAPQPLGSVSELLLARSRVPVVVVPSA